VTMVTRNQKISKHVAGELLVKSTVGNSDTGGPESVTTVKRDATNTQSADTGQASGATLAPATAAAATAAMGTQDEEMDEG